MARGRRRIRVCGGALERQENYFDSNGAELYAKRNFLLYRKIYLQKMAAVNK